jgi:hypothetical protein
MSGATICFVTGDENHGASSNGSLDDAALLEAARMRYAEIRRELASEGVDSSKEYAELLAAADSWPE